MSESPERKLQKKIAFAKWESQPHVKERRKAEKLARYHTNDEYRRHCVERSSEWQTRPHARHRRRKKLLLSYGMTLQDFENLVTGQNGLCKICDKPSVGKFHIDHCHETGVVRGLLCQKCNMGLGNFGDDIQKMLKAIEYIKCAKTEFTIKKKDQ